MPKVIMDQTGNQTRRKLVLIRRRKDPIKESKPSLKRQIMGISSRIIIMESLSRDMTILADRMKKILSELGDPEEIQEPDELEDLSWLDTPMEELPVEQRNEIRNNLASIVWKDSKLWRDLFLNGTENHREAINTQSPASGGRETKFQGLNIILVHQSVLILALILEVAPLRIRVIQFCVCIGDLLPCDVELESLRHAHFRLMRLGQGRQCLGVVQDKGGLSQLGLDEMPEKLVQKVGRTPSSTRVDSILMTEVLENLPSSADAPPTLELNTGVSTSKKSRSSKKERILLMICDRTLKTSILPRSPRKSTYLLRNRLSTFSNSTLSLGIRCKQGAKSSTF
ncbi:hypothetical protein TCAL_16798 [Tigriopus californicus]|uniref:Uncharacterized protein n=1 Tax=Tigriopus californicus TaxID=6832 RepID=A0A553PCL3_TIGCA|nr:hypothetical protein TCAL_16798 [Tigriopus californicus]